MVWPFPFLLSELPGCIKPGEEVSSGWRLQGAVDGIAVGGLRRLEGGAAGLGADIPPCGQGVIFSPSGGGFPVNLIDYDPGANLEGACVERYGGSQAKVACVYLGEQVFNKGEGRRWRGE